MATTYEMSIVEVPGVDDGWTLSVELTDQTDFVDEPFLLVTGTTNFVRVATMTDLATYPVAPDLLLPYYRAGSFSVTYDSFDETVAARALLESAMNSLAADFADGVTTWGQTYNISGP